MTLACVRRPTCEARSAARAASPITYTPAWKYRTTWRGSIPSTVISAVGTPPSAASVTVTSAGSGCADSNSRSARRCSLTSLPTGYADCRRIAARFSRCSVLTDDLPSVALVLAALRARSPMSNPLRKFPAGGRARVFAWRSATFDLRAICAAPRPSESNGLPNEDDVDAAGEFLVNLENLCDLAVLPVGGVRPRILEWEAVLGDPLTGLLRGGDELLRADDEDDVCGAPHIGGELAAGSQGDDECPIAGDRVNAAEREVGLACNRFHLLQLGSEVERHHPVARRLVAPALVDRGGDTGLLERDRSVGHHRRAFGDAGKDGFAGSVEVVDHLHAEAVLFEGDDGCGERLLAR